MIIVLHLLYNIGQPFLPLTNISSLSSLLQTICGWGCPLASHASVTLSPSRATISALSSFCKIAGGTEIKMRTKLRIFYKYIISTFVKFYFV